GADHVYEIEDVGMSDGRKGLSMYASQRLLRRVNFILTDGNDLWVGMSKLFRRRAFAMVPVAAAPMVDAILPAAATAAKAP
ncbi:unnamed protein product, partial [Tilletia controversa]